MGTHAHWGTPEKLANLPGIDGKYSASDIRDLMKDSRVYTQNTGGGPTVEVKATKFQNRASRLATNLTSGPSIRRQREPRRRRPIQDDMGTHGAMDAAVSHSAWTGTPP